MSLTPEQACAVVVRGNEVIPLPPLRGGAAALDELFRRLAAEGCPATITVDVSQVLLAELLRAAPSFPQVAAVRIVPRPARDPILARLPVERLERLIARRYTVAGGHDLLGNELCPLDTDGVAEICRELRGTGIRRICVVAAGSQARPQHEREVADAVQASMPDAVISAGSDLGGQGLVAREATVVLNCALGALTDRLLARCERALARSAPVAVLRVARGDGGYSTPAQVRALPVVALGATDALELCGAARLAGAEDCTVVLPRAGGPLVGGVRGGLAVVRPGEFAGVGTELLVPAAVLTPAPATPSAPEPGGGGDVPVLVADRDPVQLACVGAAVSRPMAWLDEVVFAESTAGLERVCRDAEQRAQAIVMTSGATPGSAWLTEVSTVAIPYSHSGVVRVRVRVAGAPNVDEAAEPAGAARETAVP
ncbi:hydantoinase/oxoprolinase N-terminal domain-containing protein [Streptomyces sp. NPDC056713]|uniref:hydantoinase/oxoprolinase N-terminal domain-containing protein n=1 Tax=Streptomyces sp. NPDC056713 TaxID=3345921 RepID=UPI0036AAF96A